jgi:DNA-binding NtrC family response regulator
MNAPVILIVDDEKNIRGTVRRALESSAQRIEEAENADRAFAVLAEHPIDVVFLDLKLPDSNGLDVLRTVHATKPDIFIIVMTAFADTESAVEAMRYGAWDFLRKPFSPDVLRKSLASACTAKARSIDPIDLAQRLESARMSITAGALQAAEEQIRAALAADPMCAAAYNLLGVVREKHGLPIDAQIFYRVATIINIRYQPARSNLDRIGQWPRSGAIDLGEGDGIYASNE